MDRPALFVVVVVRMAPVCALIGRPLPHSSSPLIPPAAPGPITLCPNIAGTWHRSLHLVSQRWWSTTDINAHLSKCRSRNCRSQDRAHYPFCFDCLSPLKQPLTHSDPIPAKGFGLYRLCPGSFEAHGRFGSPRAIKVRGTLGFESVPTGCEKRVHSLARPGFCTCDSYLRSNRRAGPHTDQPL
jgi:hypothetical protein